jgi:hypothetical protein
MTIPVYPQSVEKMIETLKRIVRITPTTLHNFYIETTEGVYLLVASPDTHGEIVVTKLDHNDPIQQMLSI